MIIHPESELEKADLLGESLVGAATEAAEMLLELLGKDNNVRFRDGVDSALQFVTEITVFYMHLIDRLAFAHLGPIRRETFGDRFVLAVLKELLRELNKERSADEFGEAFLRAYKRRQMEYAQYKILIPDKDEPLKNTLFWEFSKILFGFLDDQNPATLMLLNVLLIDMTEVVLNHTLKVEDVLRR